MKDDRRKYFQFQRRIADPAAFRAGLLIDSDAGPVTLGSVLDPWQAADFAALDPAWRRVAGQDVATDYRRAWLERPRGHSKTADIAASISWATLASPRKLSGVVAAADKEQAGLIRDAVDKLTRLNPWMGNALDVQRDKIVNTITGSDCRVLSCDAPSSYGLTPDFIVCDELTHWGKPELWDSLFSAAAKRKHCLLLVITNAGFGDSWQWRVREAVRHTAGWYFHRLDGPCASWITGERLAEQQRILPAIAYQRLWLNQWTTGSGDALREEDIASATTAAAPLVSAERGFAYVAGVDIGLSRDASAVVTVGVHVGHSEEIAKPQPARSPVAAAMVELGYIEAAAPETEWQITPGTGRLRVADVQRWKPEGGRKIELEEVERAIASLHQRFGLAAVGADPWQAAYLIERLRKAGVNVEAVDFTGANLKSMCSATLEAFAERNIELFDCPPLIHDLRSLRIEERAYGVRLTSPRGPSGHGDAATGLAVALHIARKYVGYVAPATIQGELVCYP